MSTSVFKVHVGKDFKSTVGMERKFSSFSTRYNNTFNKAINSTPSKVFLGYDQRRKEDKNLRYLINSLQNIDRDYLEQRIETRNVVQEVNRKLQEYNKIRYDKRHKKISIYSVGDLILVKQLQHKPGKNKYKASPEIQRAVSD